MEEMFFERVAADLPVDYFWDNEVHEGVVKNISKKGMCIDAEICPPSGSDIEVRLILGDEVFRLPGKVHRALRKKETSGIMSIELLDPSESYYKFVSTVMDYSYHLAYSRERRRSRERVAS